MPRFKLVVGGGNDKEASEEVEKGAVSAARVRWSEVVAATHSVGWKQSSRGERSSRRIIRRRGRQWVWEPRQKSTGAATFFTPLESVARARTVAVVPSPQPCLSFGQHPEHGFKKCPQKDDNIYRPLTLFILEPTIIVVHAIEYLSTQSWFASYPFTPVV